MQNEAPSKRFKPDRGVIDEYKGYTGNVPGTKVEEWNVNSLKNKVELFTNVVKPRKPIKIVGGLINGVSLDNFRSENIVKYLGYDDILQVERKHASGFGLGFGREDMYLEELLEKFKAGEMDYYLTTQYEREGVMKMRKKMRMKMRMKTKGKKKQLLARRWIFQMTNPLI